MWRSKKDQFSFIARGCDHDTSGEMSWNVIIVGKRGAGERESLVTSALGSSIGINPGTKSSMISENQVQSVDIKCFICHESNLMQDINLNFIMVSCKISAKFRGFETNSDTLLGHNLVEDWERLRWVHWDQALPWTSVQLLDLVHGPLPPSSLIQTNSASHQSPSLT